MSKEKAKYEQEDLLINLKNGRVFQWNEILANRPDMRSLTKEEKEAYLTDPSKPLYADDAVPKAPEKLPEKPAEEAEIDFSDIDPSVDISTWDLGQLQTLAKGLPKFKANSNLGVRDLRALLQDKLDQMKSAQALTDSSDAGEDSE